MNKQVRLTLAFIALLFACFTTAKAQNISTQGKEFWVSFMTNGFRTNTDFVPAWVKTQVLVSAKRNCSGTISNPNTGWSQDFTVRAGNITKIEIPENIAYHDVNHNESVQPRGLKIVTTDTTSVYCTNIANNSFDASYVLPIHALADDYLVQCCEQSQTCYNFPTYETSAILIVAAEDNVTVDITPSTLTLGGHPGGEEFSIELRQGETYQIRSQRGRDLSGTRITARDCKKIAVFNGNTLTCVPANMDNGYDHVFEQDMPLRSWGKNFVVTSSKDRVRDQVKITSSADNNQVFKNGELIATLNTNESYTFFITCEEISCYLETTYPAAVFLYNDTSRDQNYWGEFGDPSMLWIAPVEQRINEITFSTFDDVEAEIQNHYVNIIVKSEDIAKVYFDDQQVSPLAFSRVHGNDDYSCCRMEISHAVHHISCINGFNAHVYGFGHAKGYAYMVGSNASDLTCSTLINGTIVGPNDVFQYCVDEEATFFAEVNYPEYSLEWDFGDGTTSTQNPATHTYASKALYDAKLIVTIQGGTCDGSASETIPFTVDATQKYADPVYNEICYGEGYFEHGFSIPQILNDTILGKLQNSASTPNCQDSLLIYLSVKQPDNILFEESTCWMDGGGTYIEHGFVLNYDHPGTYTDHHEFTNIYGCDSIVTIILNVADIITKTLNEHCCEESYLWDGTTYNDPGTYQKQYVTAHGCDSIVTLNLTFGHPQKLEFDTIVCGNFIWNGQVYEDAPGYHEYIQVLQTHDNCDSIVTAKVMLSEAVDGIIHHENACNSFTWNEVNYTMSGNYTASLTSQFGCDSTAHLSLNMNYTPSTWDGMVYAHDTIAPHWVVTATEFQICSYEFSISDQNYFCQWDSVVWSLSSSGHDTINWPLEPYVSEANDHHSHCKLYVLDYTEDTIFIHATVYNECNPEGVTFSNWMVCSFYGTNESEPSDKISIIPNPNRGDMELRFDNNQPEAEIRVYNMAGTLIDAFKTSNTSMRYSLKQHRNGIYLFVFNINGTISTHKVCISQ